MFLLVVELVRKGRVARSFSNKQPIDLQEFFLCRFCFSRRLPTVFEIEPWAGNIRFGAFAR